MNKRIYCNQYTPLLRDLLKVIENSGSKFLASISEYCDINPKTDIPEFKDDDLVSFIPMDSVSELTGEIKIQLVPYKNVSKGFTRFRKGDLIWAKITPCMQNGKSAVVQNLIKDVGFGSTEFHVIRARNESINIYFIREILTLKRVLTSFQGAFTGSAGQQRIPADFIENFRYPIP